MKHSPSRTVKHALRRPRRRDGRRTGWRQAVVAVAVTVASAATTLVALEAGTSPAANSSESLFRASAVPAVQIARTTRPTELGMKFRVTTPGTITGVRYFGGPTGRAVHTGSLWSSAATRLATVRFPSSPSTGWHTATFRQGVHVVPGRGYVVSYYAPHGRYAVQKHGFSARIANGHIRAPKAAGLYRVQLGGGFPNRRAHGSNYLVDVTFVPDSHRRHRRPHPSSDPTTPVSTTPPPISSAPPTTTPPTSSDPTDAPSSGSSSATSAPPTSSAPTSPSAAGWPDATNTGVPAGTTLTPYTGSCTISSAQTITGADMSKCDSVLIRAANVVISKSLLPIVDATDGGSYSVTLTDDTVKGGNWSEGAIWGSNITATRVNVTGGQHTFHCGSNCTVTDSWLHDQYNPAGQAYHNNAFISNGGSNMVIRHNTLACTPLLNATNGGCSGDLSLFGDFDPISDVTIDDNLFVANDSSISYCLYAGYDPAKKYGANPTGIKVTNNVFQRGANNKCGVFGPVSSFLKTGAGNTWSNNTWDNGGAVSP